MIFSPKFIHIINFASSNFSFDFIISIITLIDIKNNSCWRYIAMLISQ